MADKPALDTNKPTLRRREAAALLGVTEGTLRVWGCTGRGPKFTKYGDKPQGMVVYRREDLTAWMEAQTYSSTSEFSAHKARVTMNIAPAKPGDLPRPWEKPPV